MILSNLITFSPTTNTLEKCKRIYTIQKNHFKNDLKMYIVLSHFGYFSQDLVNGFAQNIEENLISFGEKKEILKRIFLIFIEGMQNIRIHGQKDDLENFYGSFIIAKKKEEFRVVFGSLIQLEDKEFLEKRIQKLNSLKDEEVKSYYMTTLSSGIISMKGTAGLGFITMRMKSKNPIKSSFYNVSSDLNYFTMEVTIKK